MQKLVACSKKINRWIEIIAGHELNFFSRVKSEYEVSEKLLNDRPNLKIEGEQSHQTLVGNLCKI